MIKKGWEKMKEQWLTLVVLSICTSTVSLGGSVVKDGFDGSGLSPVANREEYKEGFKKVNRRIDTMKIEIDSVKVDLKEFRKQFQDYTKDVAHEREKQRIRDSLWREELKKLLREK